VIGRDEQRRRIGEGLVVEQQLGIDVAMRRDHRQVANRLVQRSRQCPLRGVGGQQPIGVQRQHGCRLLGSLSAGG
jgi:hypothetical protein